MVTITHMKNENLGAKWIVILGLVGFLSGFLGPMVLSPESNQGPLLGILITGPLGFLAGLVLWPLSKILDWTMPTQKKVLYSLCATFVLGVVAVAFAPKPKWVGRLYILEITNCRPPRDEIDNVISKWTRRMESFAWKSPRPEWKDDLRKTLLTDTGSVIDTKIIVEKIVKESNSPFKEPTFEAYKITTKRPQTLSFYIATPCNELPLNSPTPFFVDLRVPTKYMPTEKDPWPPTAITDLLILANLKAVPPEFAKFIENPELQ